MIPVIGFAVNQAVRAFGVMSVAGFAGMGFGLGRKYGRIACEMSDQMCQTISDRVSQQREELR